MFENLGPPATSNQFAILGVYFPHDGHRYALVALLGLGENIEALSYRYPRAFTIDKILRESKPSQWVKRAN